MRIISNKVLRDFSGLHPQAAEAVQGWRKKLEMSSPQNFSELKQIFNSVDKVGNYYVFNIAGNHYRLIAAIHFNTQTVYIRAVLTHGEYDLWKP
jgi:mRNA interferase HigB